MLLVVVNYFELWVMPYHSVLQGFREVDVIPQRKVIGHCKNIDILLEIKIHLKKHLRERRIIIYFKLKKTDHHYCYV